MCNKNIYFLFIIFFFECAYATSGFNNDNIADIKKVNLIQASKIKSLENQKSLLKNKLKKMQDIESQGNTNKFLEEQYNNIISITNNSTLNIQNKKTIDNSNLLQKTPKRFGSFNHASKVVLEQKYLPKNQIKASISEKNLNQLVENHKGGGGLEQKVNELEQKEKLLVEEKQQKEKELTEKISEFEKLTSEEKERHEQTVLNLKDDHKQNLLTKEKELNNLRLAELADQEKRFEKLSLEERERHNEAIVNLEESKKKELLARENELNNLRLAELADQEKRFEKLSLEERERHNEAQQEYDTLTAQQKEEAQARYNQLNQKYKILQEDARKVVIKDIEKVSGTTLAKNFKTLLEQSDKIDNQKRILNDVTKTKLNIANDYAFRESNLSIQKNKKQLTNLGSQVRTETRNIKDLKEKRYDNKPEARMVAAHDDMKILKKFNQVNNITKNLEEDQNNDEKVAKVNNNLKLTQIQKQEPVVSTSYNSMEQINIQNKELRAKIANHNASLEELDHYKYNNSAPIKSIQPRQIHMKNR